MCVIAGPGRCSRRRSSTRRPVSVPVSVPLPLPDVHEHAPLVPHADPHLVVEEGLLDPPGAAAGLRRHLHPPDDVAEEGDVDRGDAHLGALVRHGPDRRAGGDGHGPELDVVLQPIRGEDLQIFGGPLGERPLERVAAGRLPAPRELPAAEQLGPRGAGVGLRPASSFKASSTPSSSPRSMQPKRFCLAPKRTSALPPRRRGRSRRRTPRRRCIARGGRGGARGAARARRGGGGERGHAGAVEMWITDLFGHVVDGTASAWRWKFSRDGR